MTSPKALKANRVDERETYEIRLSDFEWEDIVGSVTDALTGRETATIRYRGRFIVNEPLCRGCDSPIADGPCGCVETSDGR